MTEAAAKTGKEQRGRPFAKGQSGNPDGRPQGSRNRVTIAAEELLDGQAEVVTQRAIELALAGDGTAMRLVMERIIPPRKTRRVMLELPSIEKAEDLAAAMSVVGSAMARGEISPDEAETIASFLELRRKAIETNEIAERLDALELFIRSRKP